jgi:hypothetical protein
MTLRFTAALVAGAVTLAAVSPRSAHADDKALSTCIAANESSIQLRSSHKLLKAREQSLACAADACPGLLRDACKKRLEQINASMPTIVFDVKDAAGGDVAVKLTIDGQPQDTPQGTAIALDPGEHAFVFSAAGQPEVDKSFILREGERDRHEAVVVGAAAGAGLPLGTGTGATTGGAPPPPPPPVPDRGSSWSGQKTLALVAGGVGLAGIGVGSVFGLMSHSSWSSSQSECPSASNCPQHGQAVTDHDNASSQATISTIAFAAGGVALAAGAVLWFTAPHGTTESAKASLQITPGVGPGSGGLLVKGVF